MLGLELLVPNWSVEKSKVSYRFPQRARIKQQFVAGKNIIQIAREEKRHWTTVARIVKEQDVQEYVEDLRAKFYGALEDV